MRKIPTPKRFWGFIKSKRCDNTGVAPLKHQTSGITYSDNKAKANILNEQFSSVFNKNEDKDNITKKGESPHPSMAEIKIHESGIFKLLNGLNIHKATGPDGIPTQVLKELAHELTPVMSLFFQASVNQGSIPDEWKEANVVPIFKKGDKSKAVNYRPVSLTVVLCKVMKHIICSNVMKHLDRNNILTDAQHGFRKRRSCESQLILTIKDLASSIDLKEQIDLILLDFSKAFDKVPHARLLYKMEYYGIRGHMNSWNRDFLENRQQQVVLE